MHIRRYEFYLVNTLSVDVFFDADSESPRMT